MNVDGRPCQALWPHPDDARAIQVIDQRFLPHRFVVEDLRSVQDVYTAIADMHVRGAPLIGAVAAYGMYFATLITPEELERAAAHLTSARPTAINLAWAVERVLRAVSGQLTVEGRQEAALNEAQEITRGEIERCREIGEHGLVILKDLASNKKTGPVNILTHCNAGWLACVDHGTATSPIYLAHDSGMDIHVWVDETRPRNQGALTAWELGQHGVPHTVITDNAGGQLMREGRVDAVIVGSDRTTRNGDVANKIGTYLKALAARDNDVPFYVALPSSTIDWDLDSGAEIPIEERDPAEVRWVSGLNADAIETVEVVPKGSPILNLAFDVTPARLVTGLITERGLCRATQGGLLTLFPERRSSV